MTYWIKIKKRLSDIWIETFWKSPNHLWALKVMISVAFLLIPSLILFQDPFIGTTMALGVVAMALGETDVHPRGRTKSALIALILFFITSSLVELAFPHPLFFALLILFGGFSLSLAGALNHRMQGLTFGTLLIFVYTMLGAETTRIWFYQPILYTIGALAYSAVSLLLLHKRPYRLLKEHLASGFHFLAQYINIKANLFPSDSQSQTSIRNQLAQKNIILAQQIENCKNHLYSYSAESNTEDLALVNTYYRKWFLLQEMQERAMSSHEQYDLLSEEVGKIELVEGFGQLMKELGSAINKYADTLLTDKPYKHPISLLWTLSAVETMLKEEKGATHYQALLLLMKNLKGLEINLRQEEIISDRIDVTVFNSRKPQSTSLKSLLKPAHPRFKSSVRLTLAWLLGYAIIQLFNIDKGAWILLTSLIVFQQTYSATRVRLFHRVFGTLMGVIIGVSLSQVLPTVEGQIILQLASIYLFFYWVKKNYVVAAAFITSYVLASFNILSDQGVAVMLPRIIDTLIGGAIAYLVVRFVWPDWQYKRLPQLLVTAVKKNKRYFESIYIGTVTEEEYLHNRRTAYNADNELALAWRGMRLEPKDSRLYEDSAFNLTNLNHALLSYLSAFGVHKHADELTELERVFCTDISEVLQYVLDLLNEKADKTQLDSLIQTALYWEDTLEEMQEDISNTRSGLIYNIAHVSREILVETKELVKD